MRSYIFRQPLKLKLGPDGVVIRGLLHGANVVIDFYIKHSLLLRFDCQDQIDPQASSGLAVKPAEVVIDIRMDVTESVEQPPLHQHAHQSGKSIFGNTALMRHGHFSLLFPEIHIRCAVNSATR